jgi:hypothetical protein
VRFARKTPKNRLIGDFLPCKLRSDQRSAQPNNRGFFTASSAKNPQAQQAARDAPKLSSYLSFSQNPVSFGKSFRKNGQKPVFSYKSKVAFPETEVLGKPHLTQNSIVFDFVKKSAFFGAEIETRRGRTAKHLKIQKGIADNTATGG